MDIRTRPLLLTVVLLASLSLVRDAAAQVQETRSAQQERPLRRRDRVDPSRDRDSSEHGRGKDDRQRPDAERRKGEAPLPALGAMPPPPPPQLWLPNSVSAREELLELNCPQARVCELDAVEEHFAWLLAEQTTLPWKAVVDARREHEHWIDVFAALEIEPWEVYAALGRRLPPGDPRDALDDDRLAEIVAAELDGLELPHFRCELPVAIEGVSVEQRERFEHEGQRRNRLDWVDEVIARRLEDETGWCADDLLRARSFLGSWPRVARIVYLSPMVFEASFGIELRVQVLGSKKRLRYPPEEWIRDVAENDRWPELIGR